MEHYLIRHCAPTLAGIKTGNLFNYVFSSATDLTRDLSVANRLLNPKGVYAEMLLMRENSALIYVYRESKLFSEFGKIDVKAFLDNYGYHENSICGYLFRLKSRFSADGGFPHEIGLFLGYPLHDVLGFIYHKGRNFKCTGYWKVYRNENEALKLFSKYNRCREVYARLYSQGKPVERLIVAV